MGDFLKMGDFEKLWKVNDTHTHKKKQSYQKRSLELALKKKNLTGYTMLLLASLQQTQLSCFATLLAPLELISLFWRENWNNLTNS